jgi:mono/diheme cytochrome c family protein
MPIMRHDASMRAVTSTLVASAVLFAGAACGADDPRAPDTERPRGERKNQADKRERAGAAPSGRQLFVQNCGSCHALAAASTTGTLGPDLDEHFGPHHMADVGEILETIERGPGRMPADRVKGRDARAVAEYVMRATRD